MVAPGITEQQWQCVALLVDVLQAAWYKSEAPNLASSVSALLTQLSGHQVWPPLILFLSLVLPNFSLSSMLRKPVLAPFLSLHVAAPRFQPNRAPRW